MFRHIISLTRIPSRKFNTKGQIIPELHEPKYLDQIRPNVGYYKYLNLQLRGYDFVILEKYQSHLHRFMLNKIHMITSSTWSTPHQEIKLDVLIDKSTAIDFTTNLRIYERNIQIKNALITKLPILLDYIHSTIPPGITFSIDRSSETDEKKLYFRDSVLDNLKVELQELLETPLIGN